MARPKENRDDKVLIPFSVTGDPKAIESHALLIADKFAKMPLPETKSANQIPAKNMWKIVVEMPGVREKLKQMADLRLKLSFISKHIRDVLGIEINRKDLALMMLEVLGPEGYRDQYENLYLRPRKPRKKKKGVEVDIEPKTIAPVETEEEEEEEPEAIPEEENEEEEQQETEYIDDAQDEDNEEEEEEEEEEDPYFNE